jgi:very-short-patch-repair endonuclease
MSVPEAIVWKMLRAKHLNGWKFSRQVLIGPYIADFVARREKLVVEIDGRSHDASTVYDARRDAAMVALGYQVLRYTNGDIATNLDGVSRAIDHELRLRAPADRNH